MRVGAAEVVKTAASLRWMVMAMTHLKATFAWVQVGTGFHTISQQHTYRHYILCARVCTRDFSMKMKWLNAVLDLCRRQVLLSELDAHVSRVAPHVLPR